MSLLQTSVRPREHRAIVPVRFPQERGAALSKTKKGLIIGIRLHTIVLAGEGVCYLMLSLRSL